MAKEGIICRMLSSSTMDALKSFYAERDTHAQQFAKLLADTKRPFTEEQPLTMDAFTEDWNESQFWVSSNPFPTIPARRCPRRLVHIAASSPVVFR